MDIVVPRLWLCAAEQEIRKETDAESCLLLDPVGYKKVYAALTKGLKVPFQIVEADCGEIRMRFQEWRGKEDA